jgi:hypothetical protein
MAVLEFKTHAQEADVTRKENILNSGIAVIDARDIDAKDESKSPYPFPEFAQVVTDLVKGGWEEEEVFYEHHAIDTSEEIDHIAITNQGRDIKTQKKFDDNVAADLSEDVWFTDITEKNTLISLEIPSQQPKRTLSLVSSKGTFSRRSREETLIRATVTELDQGIVSSDGVKKYPVYEFVLSQKRDAILYREDLNEGPTELTQADPNSVVRLPRKADATSELIHDRALRRYNNLMKILKEQKGQHEPKPTVPPASATVIKFPFGRR